MPLSLRPPPPELLASEFLTVINDRCVAGTVERSSTAVCSPVGGGHHWVIEKEDSVKNLYLSRHRIISMP